MTINPIDVGAVQSAPGLDVGAAQSAPASAAIGHSPIGCFFLKDDRAGDDDN